MSSNTVSEINGVLTCSCGAKATPQDRARFLRRHPSMCKKAQAFRVGEVMDVAADEIRRSNPHLYRHKSNLLRKFPEHYRKFFKGVPDNLEYIWPIRKVEV